MPISWTLSTDHGSKRIQVVNRWKADFFTLIPLAMTMLSSGIRSSGSASEVSSVEFAAFVLRG